MYSVGPIQEPVPKVQKLNLKTTTTLRRDLLKAPQIASPTCGTPQPHQGAQDFLRSLPSGFAPPWQSIPQNLGWSIGMLISWLMKYTTKDST